MFNYRLSRARRIVECCFGIMSQRFQVLFNPLKQEYKNSVKSIKACLVLHNYLNRHIGKIATENEAGEDVADQDDAANIEDNVAYVRNDPDVEAQRLRLAKHFCSPHGEITKFDQWERCNRTSRVDDANGGNDGNGANNAEAND